MCLLTVCVDFLSTYKGPTKKLISAWTVCSASTLTSRATKMNYLDVLHIEGM